MDDATIAVSPATTSTGESAAWLLDATSERALGIIAESPALAEGKVALLSLVAVRSRLGARWAARSDLVREHLERAIMRNIEAAGVFLRISETDYLVAQPDTPPLVGQVACFNALRSTLDFFLGESINADIIVHQITAIADGSIEGHKLDVVAVEAEALSITASSGQSDDASLTRLERWTPFVTNDGRSVRVSCTLEPLMHLKEFSRIGYRIRRRVLLLPQETPLSPTDQSILSRADIEKVDMATLLRGLDRLGADSGGEKQLSLVLPVSYASLTNTRSRGHILKVFEQARSRVQAGLLCEVCDIEGVPPGALLAAISLVRPFCRFVLGRLNEMPARSLAALKDAGLQGLSYDWPVATIGEAEFIGEMRGLVSMTRSVAKTLFVYQLPSPRFAAIAALLGATHATMKAALGA